ncbi:hypothetical protein N0V85_005694 [Neurospora sp. IMI 360204]|nr:hypothetical protein N0V85_005694 [Neurospora sp. IMI 360204]
MEIVSKQDLGNYLPDDAPWSSYRDHILRVQCLKRYLDDFGDVAELVSRLEQYRRDHPGEERRLFDWRFRKSPVYGRAFRHAQNHKYQVIEVEDNSNDTSIEKRFTLLDASSDMKFYVIIGRIPRCSCPLRREDKGRRNYTCGHIVYILHFVLGCPEPLIWQQAFLFKELQAIFRFSTAFQYAFNLGDRYRQSNLCAICFQNVQEQGAVARTHCCGLLVHPDCQDIRTTDHCILHSFALTKMGSREPSADTWSEPSPSPPRLSDDQIFNSHPRQPGEDGNRMSESSSGDEDGVANRSIDFFAERSQISHRSPSVESSTPSSTGSVVIKREPESPCPSPRRQLPSRAAKEATRARPDAYTGSSPRRQAPTPRRECIPKLSKTPIPLPVIPGFAKQQLVGSQPARRVEMAVSIPVVPASAQGRFGSSRAIGRGSPLRTTTTADPSSSPASATAPSVSGPAASAVSFSGAEVARIPSYSPYYAPRAPPVSPDPGPFISLPIPPAGSTFAAMSIPVTDTVSSPTREKKKKMKRNPNKNRTTGVNTASASIDQANATTASPTTATTTTTGHQPEPTEEKSEKRKAKLIKQMSRLEEDAKKVRQTKKYVEQELARLEKKKSKVTKKMTKFLETERDV